MRVLSVASEVYPLIKTGGLADVAGALPAALAAQGLEVRTLVPGYPAVLDTLTEAELAHGMGDLFGGPARILAGRAAGLDLFVIDAPHLYRRPGNPYSDPSGRDWPDNAHRFAGLGLSAALIGRGVVPGYRPDIVHAHDWQAGLAPAYLHYGDGPRPGTVMTVHNLAFQGTFPASLLGSLGLPASALDLHGVEYFGGIGFLKAGLLFADRITTVSPTYAQEVASEEGGMGLGGLLQARSAVLSGILNGIDEAVWDPAADPNLRATFSAESLERRAANKRALQERFGLSGGADAVLFAVISRLSWQKGLDLLLGALPTLLAEGGSLAVLGSGDPSLEEGLRQAAARAPGRIGVAVGYDESLAHLIQGGADALIVPSRFEPCGLTQLCAMRYGAVPVVSRVGGLNDTVIDANEVALAAGVATGFQFAPVTLAALEDALRRAVATWKDQDTWRTMQVNGMRQDLGWTGPARRYAALYGEIIRNRPGSQPGRGMVGATGIEPVTPPV
jgi:starch synthase